MASPGHETDCVYGFFMEVKAGGVRIVQKHPHIPDTKEDKDKDDQEWESGTSPPKPTLLISGAIARGDKGCSTSGPSKTTSLCGKTSSPTTCQSIYPQPHK
uniref:Uncharacterized protein n=1 Tax=Pseudonaja textilis TaxID=8673 RepID=A0A670ZG31_PSETE